MLSGSFTDYKFTVRVNLEMNFKVYLFIYSLYADWTRFGSMIRAVFKSQEV